MSKLPQPPASVRDFEYVNDDDAALMRGRLQQHFGAAGAHAFGHVVGGVRALCERSLLPPLTVLNELLAKISPNSRLPDIIARVRSLAAPLPATSVRAEDGQGSDELTYLQVSLHQAVRLHVIKTLPLFPRPASSRHCTATAPGRSSPRAARCRRSRARRAAPRCCAGAASA